MKTSTPERMVVFAPNWLGDAVMSLPLIDDVRRQWPSARLTVAARAAVAPLYAMTPSVDAVVQLRGGGGVRALQSVGENAATLRNERFDTALLLPNSFVTAWTAKRAGIPERWGYRADARGHLLTRAIARPRTVVHQADYYLALGAALGIEGISGSAATRSARVEVSEEARARARALLEEGGVRHGNPYLVMAPGAAYGSAKQWLPERFAELGRIVHQERGWRTVVVGARADARVCREVASAVPAAVDLAGRTDLPVLAAVTQASRAVVTNDSGAMHLAAAAGARVIAVFGATNEKKSAPLRGGADAPAPTIVSSTVWCRPCMLRECPIDHRCMTTIDARTVYSHL